MFKYKKVLPLILLLVGLMVLPALAEKTSTSGAPDSSGNYPIEVDHNRMVSFPGGGVYAKYEAVTTSDTITAVESGTTFIVDPVAGLPPTFNLPDADVGLEFTFVQDSRNTDNAGVETLMYINPQDTDFIHTINSLAISTMAAGDSIRSAGLSGDSIHLICGTDLHWQAISMRGAWVDSD